MTTCLSRGGLLVTSRAARNARDSSDVNAFSGAANPKGFQRTVFLLRRCAPPDVNHLPKNSQGRLSSKHLPIHRTLGKRRVPLSTVFALKSLVLSLALVSLVTLVCSCHVILAPLPIAGWERTEWRDTILFATDRSLGAGGYPGNRRDSLRFGFSEIIYRGFALRDGRKWPRGNWYDTALLRGLDSVALTVGKPEVLSDSAFYATIRRQLEEVTPDSTDYWRSVNYRRQFEGTGPSLGLVFIHGYNNDFAAALDRAARLKTLSGASVAIAFAWPSQSAAAGYVTDLEQARWSAEHLSVLLSRLNSLPTVDASSISIVAHSMGSQLLQWALERGAASSNTYLPRQFGATALLEPDIDEELFFRDALPHLLRHSTRLTIYGSTRDRALQISSGLRGGLPRIGEVREDGMECPSNLDCIDISVAASRIGMNHFDYLTPHSTIAHDLSVALSAPVPAECRKATSAMRRQLNGVWKVTSLELPLREIGIAELDRTLGLPIRRECFGPFAGRFRDVRRQYIDFAFSASYDSAAKSIADVLVIDGENVVLPDTLDGSLPPTLFGSRPLNFHVDMSDGAHKAAPDDARGST